MLFSSTKHKFSAPLTTGLRLWLDTTEFADTADSTLISTWTDKSDSGDNATASGGARPTWTHDYQGTGQDALVFDGSANVMDITGVSDTTQTWFVGLRRNANSGVLGVGTTSNRGMDIALISASIRNRSWNGDGDLDEVQVTGSSLGDFYVFAAKLDTGSTHALINEFSTDPTSHPTPAGIQIDEIGAIGTGLGRDFFDGGMLEVLNYDRVLSDAEMTYMQKYFQFKWPI